MCLVLLIIATLFVSCANHNKQVKDESTAGQKDASQTDIVNDNPILYADYGSIICHKVDDLGVIEAGNIKSKQVSYNGEPLHVAVDILEGNTEQTAVLPLDSLFVLFVDGNVIPFSINDNQESMTQPITLHLNQEETFIISFTPYNAIKGNTVNVKLCVIPNYSKSVENVYDNFGFISSGFSVKAKVDAEKMKQSTSLSEDKKDLLLKDLSGTMFVQSKNGTYEKTQKNCTISDIDKLFFFSDDFDSNYAYNTVVFCNGEVMNGFSGKTYLSSSKGISLCVGELDLDQLKKTVPCTLFSLSVPLGADDSIEVVRSENIYLSGGEVK